MAAWQQLHGVQLDPFELHDGTLDDEPFIGEPVTYVLLMGSEPGAPEPRPGDEGLPASWIEKAGAAERGGEFGVRHRRRPGQVHRSGQVVVEDREQ